MGQRGQTFLSLLFRKLKPVHNYAYRCIRTLKKYHPKSSNKSRKTILRGGEDPSSCRRVTFRPLKLLRNTLKVTRGHPQSYSRIVPKFTYPAALLFHSSPSKISQFNTSNFNCHVVNMLQESFILTFIRVRIFFRKKYAAVEHE